MKSPTFCAENRVFGQVASFRNLHRSLLRILIVLLIMCDTIRRMLEGTRPVDQLMLWIEFLILVFIVWEFGWKVKDWYRERRRTREYEDEMTRKLSQISPEHAKALTELFLEGKQPPSGIAELLQPTLHPLLARDFVGWFIAVEYRDYMRRWAKRRQAQSQVRKSR
jgi:hypothetical protein